MPLVVPMITHSVFIQVLNSSNSKYRGKLTRMYWIHKENMTNSVVDGL